MSETMNDVLDVIPVIFIAAFVFITIIAGSISRSKMNKKKKKPSLHQQAAMNKPSPATGARADVRTYRLMEDRENDWLARQYREERASERRFSAMYGLKRSHEANCAARSLRDEHRYNCDAEGVDTGTGR